MELGLEKFFGNRREPAPVGKGGTEQTKKREHNRFGVGVVAEANQTKRRELGQLNIRRIAKSAQTPAGRHFREDFQSSPTLGDVEVLALEPRCRVQFEGSWTES